MSGTMSAKEICEAWLQYVNEMFTPEVGSKSSQEGDEMLRQLVASKQLEPSRETWRPQTDKLIEELLEAAPEARFDRLATLNPTAMALVQDRIQCVTEVLIGFAQKDLQISAEGGPALAGFFRQMLLQKS